MSEIINRPNEYRMIKAKVRRIVDVCRLMCGVSMSSAGGPKNFFLFKFKNSSDVLLVLMLEESSSSIMGYPSWTPCWRLEPNAVPQMLTPNVGLACHCEPMA